MLFSSVENWQAMFDHVDCRAPIYDFDGKPRSFEELLKSAPPGAAAKIAPDAQATRHEAMTSALDQLQVAIADAKLDVMVVVGDDQREIFSDDCRPAIAVYYGDSIRNAPAPADPTDSWYLQDQRKRMEDKHERFYPCNAALGTYFATGLTDRGFDITAMKSLTGEQFEGHAYSFIHRRFMPKKPIPMVPVI
jgi:3-O-methylgallate 3,4-dioxygenase